MSDNNGRKKTTATLQSDGSVDQLVKEVLDEDASQLDANIHSRLNTLRAQAVERVDKPSVFRWIWSNSYGPWLPMTALASLFVVAVSMDFNLLGGGQSEQIAQSDNEALLLEMAFGDEDMVFYQNLAFVEWMDDEGGLLIDIETEAQHDA